MRHRALQATAMELDAISRSGSGREMRLVVEHACRSSRHVFPILAHASVLHLLVDSMPELDRAWSRCVRTGKSLRHYTLVPASTPVGTIWCNLKLSITVVLCLAI